VIVHGITKTVKHMWVRREELTVPLPPLRKILGILENLLRTNATAYLATTIFAKGRMLFNFATDFFGAFHQGILKGEVSLYF
jgi:hypothetical protein